MLDIRESSEVFTAFVQSLALENGPASSTTLLNERIDSSLLDSGLEKNLMEESQHVCLSWRADVELGKVSSNERDPTTMTYCFSALTCVCATIVALKEVRRTSGIRGAVHSCSRGRIRTSNTAGWPRMRSRGATQVQSKL